MRRLGEAGVRRYSSDESDLFANLFSLAFDGMGQQVDFGNMDATNDDLEITC